MAQLFDIIKVTVGPRNLEAVVAVSPDAPLLTSEDPEGTEHVLEIMPGLVDHMCLGDASSSFGEVVADTELAHLLEHVTVELLAQTDAAGDVTGGQTVEVDERTYKITLACSDDVLVAGALSSAVWILQWAYSGGGEPEPDVEAIASGLVDLVDSLGESEPENDSEPLDDPFDDEPPYEEETVVTEFVDAAYEPIAEDEPIADDEADDLSDTAVTEPVADEPADEAEKDLEPTEEPVDDLEEPEPAADADSADDFDDLDDPDDPEPAEDPAEDQDPDPDSDPEDDDPWGMKDVPRPHLVR